MKKTNLQPKVESLDNFIIYICAKMLGLRFAYITFSLLVAYCTVAQSKLGVSITNPNDIHLCQPSEYIDIEVRNITASTVTGIETKVVLPSGMTYIVGSISGTGVSEKDVSNLTEPIFSVSNLSITQALNIKIKVKTACSISAFLNNGGLAIIKTTTIYAGGSVASNGSVLNIKQPALTIQTITNQLKVADLYEKFERKITLKNSGSGRLTSLTFSRTYNMGQELIYTSASSNTIGTITTSTLDTTDFKTIGNGDIYLDLNETYTFTDSVKVISCSNLNTTYTLSWGCYGSTCKTTVAAANISISSKNPVLVITPTSNTTNCLSDNNLYDQQLVIFNSGNDTARDLDINVFQTYGSGYYQYSISQILASTFTVKTSINGTPQSVTPYSTTNTVSTGVYACLGANAKGEAYLKLQNIAPGDSLVLRWKTKSCCPDVCNLSTLYNQRWQYKATYKNQCGTIINFNPAYGSVGTYQSFQMQKLIPTDISSGETKTLEFTLSNGSLLGVSTRSQMQVHVKLPSLLTHSLAVSDFRFEHANGSSWSPSRIVQYSDTVIAFFNGTPTVTLSRSELLIKIKGICNSSSASQTQNLQVNINYNPDTTCATSSVLKVFCTNDDIRVHCANGCAAGLHFNSFVAKRISYGQPDNNNDGVADATGSLNYDKIKQNRLMFGDTLLTTFSGKVHNAGSISSWSYGKATSTLDYGRFLSVKSAALSIYRNGNHVVTCADVPVSFTSSGNAKTYTFDLSLNSLVASGCIIYPAFTYLNIDSLVLNVKYVVDQNPGNAEYDLQIDNDFYLSTVPNPSASQRYSCDNFSARLKLIGYYFTNWGSNTLNVDGCGTIGISQNYYLSVGVCCSNYAGGNIFPYEYRKWAKLKEIIFDKPIGFDIVNSNFNQSRTLSTGTVATQYLNNITPYTSTSTQAKYKTDSFYTDLGGSVLLSDDGFYGTYSTNLRPNCKAPEGLNYFNYGFVFQRLGFLGSELDTMYSTNSYDVVNYNRTDLEFTVTNDYVYPEKDTVEWHVRITNKDPKASANNVWVGALKNANVEIVAVRDKTTNALLTSNLDVHKLGDLSPNGYKDLIIYAKYISCSADSVLLYLGYDCGQYPDSIKGYTCSFYTTKLKYEPINTRLDANVITQLTSIDLCAKQVFKVQINNTGSPKVYNSYLDLELRPGLTIFDTAWLFVDGRSDSICISGFENRGGNVYRWHFTNRDSLLDQNGLNGVNSTAGYKMILKFWLTTDCNFTSSSSFLIRPGGYLKCGTAVNAPYILSDPIQIKNVVTSYFSAIDFYMRPLEACGYQDSTIAKFINLGPNKTGYSDKFILALPIGVGVDLSYIDTGYNAPGNKPMWDSTHGQNIYSWQLPANIAPGDSCIFRIKTQLNNSYLSCGIKQYYAQAVVTSPAFCVSSNSYCDINVATSSLQLKDSVIKEAYNLSINRAQSIPSGTYEKVTLDYAISNTGADKAPGTALAVQVVVDANANGIVDLGEGILSTDTITQSLNSGASLNLTHTFEVLSSLSCNLLLHISEANCVCNSATQPINKIQLLNAGRDSIICPNQTMTLGYAGNSANTYSWNNTTYVGAPDSSSTSFLAPNPSTSRDTVMMILTTDKGSCSSSDTASIIIYAGMQLNMPDSVNLCIGSSILIGDIASGGESKLKNTSWQPTSNLSSSIGYKTIASPTQNTKFTLTVRDVAGCSISDSTLVVIKAKPQASFAMQDSCAETHFTFTNTSDYAGTLPDSLHWDFDYLGESQYSTISYKIDSSLLLPVHLYVSNQFGCWDTVTKNLEIYPLPVPAMTYTAACEESSAKLEALSSISYGTLTHQWIIDGDAYTGTPIYAKVPTAAWSYAWHTATSDRGCKRSITDSFLTLDKPEIGLSLTDQCFKDSVDFEVEILSGNRDSITSFNWDLGDGSASTNANLSHFYKDTGTYTVTLYVANAYNCADTATAWVTIHPKPESNFRVANICLGDTLLIEDASTLSNGIPALYWNTGSGYGLGAAVLKFKPQNTGSYIISQKIISENGCLDSSTQNYRVYYKEKLNHMVQGSCVNTNIIITATDFILDSLASHRWIVNGDSFSTSSFSYLFPKDTTFTIQQRLTTNTGCISDSSFEITIRPAPVAQIKFSDPCKDNLIRFESGTTNTTYLWELQDGTQNTNQKFDHTFAQPNTYKVSLLVSNQYNCQTKVEDSVIVTNIVNPDFKISNTCENDGQWVVNTTIGLKTPATKATFDMDNGDLIADLDSFEYTYNTAGAYNILFNISTLPGCSYTTSKPVIIYPLPIADFKLSPETPDIFTPEITGTDNSTNADSIRYFLSDGSSYFSRHFAHQFLDSGNYEIQQWVRSQFGCLDSITKQLYVNFAYHLYVPNAFSPNKDDLNEGFKPVGLGLKHYDMEIYNRWGEKVFESSEQEPSWLGTDAIDNYYLYQIRAYDFRGFVHYYKGVVYLIR